MESILSAFSRVDWEEKLALQVQIAPLGDKWQKKLKKEVEKIKK